MALSQIKTASIASGAVDTAQLAADAVDNTILDLADDFAFTGTISGAGEATSVAIIADQKAQNTAGGGFTAGSYVTRDLNTELFDPDGIVSIASNQFTLGAGKYIIDFRAPGRDSQDHRCRLRDITNTTTIALGNNIFSDNNDTVISLSIGSAYVDISSSTTYEIQHFADVAIGNGFGTAINVSGEAEIYTIVKILKVG